MAHPLGIEDALRSPLCSWAECPVTGGTRASVRTSVRARMPAEYTDPCREETPDRTSSRRTRNATAFKAENEPPMTCGARRRDGQVRAETDTLTKSGCGKAPSCRRERWGQEGAGRSAQRRKRTRTTEQRRNTHVVATSTVRRTGGSVRRHTSLCFSRRRRPLALRPRSAAPSLPSSAIAAWCAHPLMSSAAISQSSQLASSVVRRLVPPSPSSTLACPSSISIRASLSLLDEEWI
jgi:hypothetical protein